MLLQSILAITAFTSGNAALTTRAGELKAPIEGYGVFTPQWEVQVTPNGPSAILNGTVQQVHAQLVRLNPNWDADFQFKATGPSKRADFGGADPHCFGPWGAADLGRIREGIYYLRSIRGTRNGEAGPGKCARVSCSYNAAIWWCNDNAWPIRLGSFGDIADGAQYVADRCQQGAWFWTTTQGHVFHRDKWNVLVRGDYNRC